MPEGLGRFVPKPQPQSFIEAEIIGGSVSASVFGDGSVNAPLTDVQLRATPVPISGTVTASGPLTDAQLRAISVPVSGAFFQGTQPVSGTFWQATQPISGNVGITGSVSVTGTFWQATQPVSATALPLPTGAATLAKQPALGTAGTSSADVITVQGATSGTPQPVNTEGAKATYRVMFDSAVATAATDIIELQGSASKTIRITRCVLSFLNTTANNLLRTDVIRRSTTATGGTPATATIAKMDTNNSAATAVVRTFTGVATSGTVVATLAMLKVQLSTLPPTIALAPVEFYFGDKNGQSLVVRGTSDYICVSLAASAPANSFCTGFIEWTEE